MNKLKWLFVCALAFCGASCSDDNEPVHFDYEEGESFVDYSAADNYIGSHTVMLQRSYALKFCDLKGVEKTDQFLARHKEQGTLTYLNWGFKYAGIQGDDKGEYDRVSHEDTILVGLGFSDTWRVGTHELLLLRDGKYQVLDEFDFKILDNVECDLSKVKGGVIYMTADGWDNAGTSAPIDSLRFVETTTGKQVEKLPSKYKEGNARETFQFDRSKFETGHYEMWIDRWNYGFTQKLAEFDYFKYAFVESDPLEIDKDGNFIIKFTLDSFAEDDNFTITTNAPYARAYIHQNVKFEKENWDPETKVYTYTTQDKYWKKTAKDGMTFAISMKLSGVRNIAVTGDAVIKL